MQKKIYTPDRAIIPGYKANVQDNDHKVLGVVTDRYKIVQNEYIITGERLSPYLIFSNSHDGSGAIKVAMTPIRVVCQNTLNLALSKAKRSWSAIHTGNIGNKMEEAGQTLCLAEQYMDLLGREIECLSMTKLPDQKVMEYIEVLLPELEEASPQQQRNVKRLQDVGKNAYRFINAVSDFATHAKPLHETSNYKENLFIRTMDGNIMIDKAYQIVKAT